MGGGGGGGGGGGEGERERVLDLPDVGYNQLLLQQHLKTSDM